MTVYRKEQHEWQWSDACRCEIFVVPEREANINYADAWHVPATRQQTSTKNGEVEGAIVAALRQHGELTIDEIVAACNARYNRRVICYHIWTKPHRFKKCGVKPPPIRGSWHVVFRLNEVEAHELAKF